MERNNDRSGRGFSGPRLQPMVQRLLDQAPNYEPRARVDDGAAINEVVLVKRQQPGAASALHAKWQAEGYVDRLTRDDCEALARAGFQINKDRDGFWTWWREKKLCHMWLAVGPDGWRSTTAPHPKGQWKVIGNVYAPTVPYFPEYPVTPQTIVREGLIVAVIFLRDHAPEKVFSEKFFSITRDLCDEAVLGLATDKTWFDDIVQHVSMEQVYDSSLLENTESVRSGEASHS